MPLLDQKKHKNILLNILKDIYNNNELAPVLGFKGGTAAFIFYDLPRFSVDLDFDLLKQGKKKNTFAQIKKIVNQHGKIKEQEQKRSTLFFIVSYSEQMRNIKVEINLRKFDSSYEIKNYLGVSMKVMTKQDMAAHKMVAMYERIDKTSRDVFDVWYFLDNQWDINTKIIENRTGLSFEDFLNECIALVKDIPENRILSGLGELLDRSQKDWAKEKLKEDLIFLLKLRLDTVND
ncbi:MAG: nucleotidyl transferase AbiEii/AbiGii toxin family protein [Candidatus Paceibacteria bacterium]